MKTQKSKMEVENFIVYGIQPHNYHEIPENFSEMKWHILAIYLVYAGHIENSILPVFC